MSANIISLLAASSAVVIYLLNQYRARADIEDEFVSNVIIPYLRLSRRRRYHAQRRRSRHRSKWSVVQSELTDRQFRRYFRMNPELFDELCSVIKDLVGEEEFKSEEYLSFCLDDDDPNQSNNIAKAHAKSTGGFISGEVKLAMTLRILGGGSFMDIAMLFGNSFNHAHKIVGSVVENWLLHPQFYPIDGTAYCRDQDRMRNVARQFHVASQGIMTGCIGAIDGWVVKVKPPSARDGVHDPASFYSRKGFFGINVQAIVDKNKRVLYRSILSRGAEHDSTAFKNCSLYAWLMDNWNTLRELGYYFIGDSAYALRSFIHTPYDNALHGTPEDNYNFFHSSARISVECAFGEIDLRWGIFWRPLQYSLRRNIQIIDACMRLHNFIIDHRPSSLSLDNIDRDVFDDECRRFFYENPAEEGVFGGESDPRLDARGGRPLRIDTTLAELGRNWRDENRDDIARQGLSRPPSNWFRDRNRLISDM